MGTEAGFLQIGAVRIAPPLVLGPMAGYTNLPFRLLCHRAGAGLVTSEMISARALAYGSPKTLTLMRIHPREHPVAIQIFGGEPEYMAEAAQRCVAAGADIVDINMGCTVPKVRKAGAGVELMRRPQCAVAVTRAVVEAVSVPVTVKMRAGLVPGDESYLDLSRRLQDVGVAAIALHARPASAAFWGRADWSAIARLVENVDIPVIGNGDVIQPQQALEMLSQTGCRGVMIARGALGRPWLFRQAQELLAGKPPSPDPPAAARLAIAICHAQMLALELPETQAAHQMRGQIGFYSKGLPHSAWLRRRCQHLQSIRELAEIVHVYMQSFAM